MRRALARVTFAMFFFVALTTALGVVADVATRHWGRLPQSLTIAAFSAFLAASLYRAIRVPRTGQVAPLLSTATAAADDPGWNPLRAPTGGLIALRAVFIAFAGSLVLFAFIIGALPGLPNGPVVPWIPILAGIAAAIVLLQSTAERPLDCSSPRQLALTYRARFFARLALTESVALLAFTSVFLGAPSWAYYMGAAISLARLASYVAPTKASLARDQQALDARGCGLSLVDAMNASPATR